MNRPLTVVVSDICGNQLEQELLASKTVADLREVVALAWSLDPAGFRLVAASSLLADNFVLGDLATTSDDNPTIVSMQLLKFDPLPELGQFDISHHSGVEVRSSGHGKDSTLVKTRSHPDSNNVFLRHCINEPCFVEFEVMHSYDECSFGVARCVTEVEASSGVANLGLKGTWTYSKAGQMPTLIMDGQATRAKFDCGTCNRHLDLNIPSFEEGDRVALHVDPEDRRVDFYLNGDFVASNLPDHPLPLEEEGPLRIYAMVDQEGDEISVVRFGPGKP